MEKSPFSTQNPSQSGFHNFWDNFWDPLQNENVGPLAQKVWRISRWRLKTANQGWVEAFLNVGPHATVQVICPWNWPCLQFPEPTILAHVQVGTYLQVPIQPSEKHFQAPWVRSDPLALLLFITSFIKPSTLW